MKTGHFLIDDRYPSQSNEDGWCIVGEGSNRVKLTVPTAYLPVAPTNGHFWSQEGNEISLVNVSGKTVQKLECAQVAIAISHLSPDVTLISTSNSWIIVDKKHCKIFATNTGRSVPLFFDGENIISIATTKARSDIYRYSCRPKDLRKINSVDNVKFYTYHVAHKKIVFLRYDDTVLSTDFETAYATIHRGKISRKRFDGAIKCIALYDAGRSMILARLQTKLLFGISKDADYVRYYGYTLQSGETFSLTGFPEFSRPIYISMYNPSR